MISSTPPQGGPARTKANDQSRRQRPAGMVASVKLQRRLAALVRDIGANEAARRVGTSRESLFRLIAGGLCRRGTIALAEQAFAPPASNP